MRNIKFAPCWLAGLHVWLFQAFLSIILTTSGPTQPNILSEYNNEGASSKQYSPSDDMALMWDLLRLPF